MAEWLKKVTFESCILLEITLTQSTAQRKYATFFAKKKMK